MATTPFVLTGRESTYPYDQWVNDAPIKVVDGIFDGAAVAAYKGSAVAANDVAQILTIPAGAFVLTVTAKVLTAEGGTCTFDVGDDATTDGYLDGVDGNTAANSTSFNATTTETFGVGKYYTAANTIDVKLMTGTAAAVVVALSAAYIMIGPRLTA